MSTPSTTDTNDRLPLGEFEEIVLLAVGSVGEGAYGISIRDALAEAMGRAIAIGSVYITLERLEKKGFVESRLGEKAAARGGKAKRYFETTRAGLCALSEMERLRKRLRQVW